MQKYLSYFKYIDFEILLLLYPMMKTDIGDIQVVVIDKVLELLLGYNMS